jgi:hypothetical protein
VGGPHPVSGKFKDRRLRSSKEEEILSLQLLLDSRLQHHVYWNFQPTLWILDLSAHIIICANSFLIIQNKKYNYDISTHAHNIVWSYLLLTILPCPHSLSLTPILPFSDCPLFRFISFCLFVFTDLNSAGERKHVAFDFMSLVSQFFTPPRHHVCVCVSVYHLSFLSFSKYIYWLCFSGEAWLVLVLIQVHSEIVGRNAKWFSSSGNESGNMC